MPEYFAEVVVRKYMAVSCQIRKETIQAMVKSMFEIRTAKPGGVDTKRIRIRFVGICGIPTWVITQGNLIPLLKHLVILRLFL